MAVQFQITHTLPAPPERAFEGLTNLENAEAWMPGLIRIERLDGGAAGVGSRWRETRTMYGKEVSEEFEVTTFQPPSRFGLRVDGSKGSSGNGVYTFDYRLSPDGAGTRVVMDASIGGISRVREWITRLFSGMYKKMIAKDLHALAEYLRGQDTSAA
ncbi:MAG TPA: SRPBCC family protein [Longimicrobium sp.]|nr:SRPBCC family protein [Longimicrobium sp.]